MFPNKDDLLKKADPEITKFVKLFLKLGLGFFSCIVAVLGISFFLYFKVYKSNLILFFGLFSSVILGLFLSYFLLKRFYEEDK